VQLAQRAREGGEAGGGARGARGEHRIVGEFWFSFLRFGVCALDGMMKKQASTASKEEKMSEEGKRSFLTLPLLI
jgi:hypothetical protein